MHFLKAFEDWLINYIDAGLVFWVEIFGLVLAALFLGYMVNKIILVLEERAGRTKTVWDDALLEASRKPAVWLVWIVGVNFAASLAARRTESEWYDHIAQANRLAVIFLLTLFLINLIKRVERNLVHPGYMKEPLDETTVRAMGKLLRAAVLITSVLIVLQLLGYSVSGVLAFGGIGGLAVGFAAKDLLANFFGGLMIYLDRPFAVGDWVRSPDKEIEGTVEDIGWRLTRIRTFDKRPLYIPNSVFNTISVENPSRMHNRRIYETIGVRYDDIDAVAAIVVDVRAMLENHEAIDQSQTMIVSFNQFAASSLNFFIYTFTKTINWIEYHHIKQDVLLKIAQIIADHGAQIALPTSTIHLAGSQHSVPDVGAVERGGDEQPPGRS
ncbi:MAG: mechanosensitive ion channel family protein [Porticoccaceae bacterium]|nr:mechanosensitive ion channel family protein [Porticoccaceae bacterium]